jgi:hypothetical protein
MFLCYECPHIFCKMHTAWWACPTFGFQEWTSPNSAFLECSQSLRSFFSDDHCSFAFRIHQLGISLQFFLGHLGDTPHWVVLYVWDGTIASTSWAWHATYLLQTQRHCEGQLSLLLPWHPMSNTNLGALQCNHLAVSLTVKMSEH